MSSQISLYGDPVETETDLFDRFGVPPFSVIDTKQGYFQEGARKWRDLGIMSELGRDAAVGGSKMVAKYVDGVRMTGLVTESETSIFNPYLCELIYSWFCPPGGLIIDPFAGGSVRGIVANKLGYRYHGVELRQEQVESNIQQGKDICNGNAPVWICGDSEEKIPTFKERYFDFAFSCPPYHDLEVYSKDPRDLSNMEYLPFLKKYHNIIRATTRALKDDSFFVLVVGDTRDKKGNYKGFVKDTIILCEDAGLNLYNDMVLLNSISSASMRAGKQFESSRKVAKVHQNILVFLKGNAKRATEKICPACRNAVMITKEDGGE